MDGPEDRDLAALVSLIPEGSSRTHIAGQPWSISRTTRAGGKVVSIDAEHLGGTEQLGANVWLTTEGAVLRPCEVPEEKVMQFLRAAAPSFSE